jgi:hypothetical protein
LAGKVPKVERGFPTMLRNFSTDLSLRGRNYESGGDDFAIILY